MWRVSQSEERFWLLTISSESSHKEIFLLQLWKKGKWSKSNSEFYSLNETPLTECIFCSAVPQQKFWGKIDTHKYPQKRKKICFGDKILLWNGDHCTNSTPYNLIGKHKNADWRHFPSQTIGDSGINLQRYSNSHASPSHWMQTFPFSLFWKTPFFHHSSSPICFI